MKALSADRVDLAFRALAVRQSIDNVLAEHGATLQLGWHGKWAKLQVQFADVRETAVTIVETTKGKAQRYLSEAEENTGRSDYEIGFRAGGQAAATDYHNLLMILSDIRVALGVAGKPMLTELAGICAALVAERDALRAEVPAYG